MAFTNNINKEALKDALINWVLGTDGSDGATEYVFEEIPWSDDMGIEFWQDEVFDKIDEAIGSRCDDGGECWEVSKLVQDLDYHGRRFLKFIDKKVEDIYNTYQEAIDKLNAKNANNAKKEVYYWTLDGECFSVRSEKNFDSKEDCYEDMCQAVNKKVLCNIKDADFDSDDDMIDINITATRNQIKCQSYSGTCTWTVEKV